jgi:SNF2 family DNA or RNA helicase
MQQPEMLDNVNKTVKDDLTTTIKKGDKLSIAAACFSIFAYQALKKQLDGISELRFIFTSPTFLDEKTSKEQREFYIPRLNRERSLYGTEFEVKLRNELTQKAIARECAEWVKKKVKFRSNYTDGNICTFMNVTGKDETVTYTPLQKFTTSDIGCERANNIINFVNKLYSPVSAEYVKMFDSVWNDTKVLKDVTDQIVREMSSAYKENSPEFIYFVAIYNIFSAFLDDISDDVLPNEANGFKETVIWNKLYDFQKDAVLAIINKLETYNGCILADSVGLGKTFTALAVIKYYQQRNKDILVLCPKKLGANWNTFNMPYKNNPVLKDRFDYKVLYHTDLSREYGMSNGIDLDRIVWDNFGLIVIDESHNFRNGSNTYTKSGNDNRYDLLMKKVIQSGVQTKVLMLSATPVNNGFSDLRHQLELAYEGNPELINSKLDVQKDIDTIFRQAQGAFNKWGKLPPEERTTEQLLSTLDFDFFTMLDSVTIARSRKHIEKYYNMSAIGKFPERLPPINKSPALTDLKKEDTVNYSQIYAQLMQLNLAVYIPTTYLLDSERGKYDVDNKSINRHGREMGLRKLMCVNLMKRLESSVYSFRITLERVLKTITDTINAIDTYSCGSSLIETTDISDADLDTDDSNFDVFTSGKALKIDLADIDYTSWRRDLESDADILTLLSLMIADITPEHDTKLQTLIELVKNKIANPINAANKKVLIFSAFSDTVEYLYNNINDKFGLDVAMVTGSTDGKTTAKIYRADMNTVLTLFSPISKDKELLMPGNNNSIDILIATDCISEGQNLQDCDYCINYDIHWNPVRIIQRFGRIDRIGSRNEKIQLVNFWPDVDLDEYLNLKGRVETRMKASILTATGDDNLIDPNEQGDLEYRKAQLLRLQDEVVDLEEMQSGISIMDLGLNEFRLDLLEYINSHKDVDFAKVPKGLHAVVKADKATPHGTFFILKNVKASINVRGQNLLHPFYMIFVGAGSTIHINHLQPKKMLDLLRKLCKGQTEPIEALCRSFNSMTNDGKNMDFYSSLLYFAIKSIVDINEGNLLDSFLSGGKLNFSSPTVEGLDDFELICFITVM